MAGTITAPATMTKSRHWVVHKDKAPEGKEGRTGWNLAENWFSFDEALQMLERRGGFDGLGFIVARESGRKSKQIIGGDLDNCRDPITGEGSEWAIKILKDLNACSAPSISGCGYRFFCLGKLPDGTNEVQGHGADDLPSEMKEHILAAKPKAREKLEKYGPAEVWNGMEIYEDGPKHLTITGEWLPEYPVDLEVRQKELEAIIAPYLKDVPASSPPPRSPLPTKKTSGAKFPTLDIRDVIDMSGFVESGGELVGTHPSIGSVTGANLKVNVSENSWCNFHNDLKRGGDPWVWLACESGAVEWEKAGKGVLKDPDVVAITMMHAAKRGLIPETPDIVAAFKRANAPKELWDATPDEVEALLAAVREERGMAPMSEEDLKTLPNAFNPRLEVRLEAGNFITKYMVYAKTTSDAYEEYHYASGLVLASIAADRQIVISMRHGDIYPNIWIFPIGDSTVSRKTTAHKLCKMIVRTKFPKRSLPSSFSPEALMDAIAATPRCYYLKDEAGSLLSSLCKDYMAETRDFLAEIYECDDYYRKLKKSECQITDPYITQYLMTTPDNLKEYTTPLDLTSGWLLRYMWMYPNYPKDWKPFAEKDGEDFEAYTTIYGEYNLLVEKLVAPRRLSLTTESLQFYQDWQRDIEETAMENADNITKALAGRLMTHAIKMAALFTVCREDFDENSKIELPHIQEAARQVVEYFLPIGRIIIEEVARAESKNVQDKIIGTLKRYNGLIKQRDLLRVLHMKVKDVDESIEALILSEEIARQVVKSKKGNVLYYKLEECHSDIVSHPVVYKGNNEGGLYTPPCDTKTLCQMGQHPETKVAKVEETLETAEPIKPKCNDAPIPKTPRFPGMKKRVCCLCGKKSTFDLTPYSNPAKGINGFICADCHIYGPPAPPEEANPQTTLESEA